MRVNDFDIRQIIFASFLMVTLGVNLLTVINVFGTTDDIMPFLDEWAKLVVQSFLFIFWPMIFYIAIFTRFNNPFRKKETV